MVGFKRNFKRGCNKPKFSNCHWKNFENRVMWRHRAKKRVFLKFQKRISQAFAVWFYWNWKCTRIILCSYCWFILWQKNPLGGAAGVKMYQFIVLKGSEWLQLGHFLIDFVQFRTEYTQKSTFLCVHKNIKIFHFDMKKKWLYGILVRIHSELNAKRSSTCFLLCCFDSVGVSFRVWRPCRVVNNCLL